MVQIPQGCLCNNIINDYKTSDNQKAKKIPEEISSVNEPIEDIEHHVGTYGFAVKKISTLRLGTFMPVVTVSPIHT